MVVSDVGKVGVLCVAGPITYGGAVCIVLYCSPPSRVCTTYSLFTGTVHLEVFVLLYAVL